VQKFADNARRIRQSPRYARGAATAAAVRTQDLEDDPIWPGSDADTEYLRCVHAERTKSRRLENHEGAKMPELPSVVEEEYGRVIERDRKKSTKRHRTGRADFVEDHGYWEQMAKAEPEPREDRYTRTPPMQPMPSRPAPSQLANSKETENASVDRVKAALDYRLSYKRPVRYGMQLDDGLEAASNRRVLFHATPTGKAWRQANYKFDAIVKSFKTHHLWARMHSADRTISPDTLTRDVDMFFEKVDVNESLRIIKKDANTIVDGLLRLSLDLGSFSLVRSLLLWKQAAGVLSTEDLCNTATSIHQIAKSQEPEAFLHLYAELLTTPYLQGGPKEKRLSAYMRLQVEVYKLSTLEEYSEWGELLDEIITIPTGITRGPAAAELVERECRQLLVDGHLPCAVKLWCSIYEHNKDLPTQLDDDLFAAAITACHLSLCAQMLRTKNRSTGKRVRYNSGHQVDALIRLCFEERALGMMQSLFGEFESDALRNLGKLSPQSYAYLCQCVAYTTDRSQEFKKYFHHIPENLRKSVVQSSVTNAALALIADWKVTQNLDLVRSRYKNALKGLAQQTSQDVRPLQLAMIEVELSANQPIEAIGSLSILNQHGADGSIAILTALALAKQKNWLAFNRLFDTLKHDRQTWNWTHGMKRAFNNVLHLFSRSHTAEQFSDFVSMSINDLRFRPNPSTSEIVLSGLVSKKALWLLKDWIKLSGTDGYLASVNADIAAATMKTWSLGFRHSHVMVVMMCRSLARAAPSLHSEALLNVIREAIGYDLRKLHGVNTLWIGPIIRARQTLYAEAWDTIPLPGVVWNGRLLPERREGAADQPLVQCPESQERDVCSALSDPLTASTARDDGTSSLHRARDTFDDSFDEPNRDVSNHSDAVSAAPAATSWAPTRTIDSAPQSDSVTATTTREGDTGLPDEIKTSFNGLNKDVTNHSDAGSDETVGTSWDPNRFTDTARQEIDAVTSSTSATRQPDASLEDFRTSYEMHSFGDQKSNLACDELQTHENLERQMVSQFSLRRYDSVLKLYEESLGAVGLPASPRILEVAVQASLRLHNGRQEAENIVTAACNAGMNATCAIGPLLMDQIAKDPPTDATSVAELRAKVIEYYRVNETNGLHVKHHLATTAAHTLIQAGFAQHAINLLSTIMQSSWSADKPLDIAAMSVWLAGYAAEGHLRGMHWVIQTVLHSEHMCIDKGFMAALKRARRPKRHLHNGTLGYGTQLPRADMYLRQWYDVCRRRCQEQMQESKVFGRKLVTLLSRSANGPSVRTTDSRNNLRGRRMWIKRRR
jgi:hypothetical protein